jgi:hypothetical protein
MLAADGSGAGVGTAATSGASDPDAPDVLEIQATGIALLAFTGGGGEGLLVDICITDGDREPDDRDEADDRDDPDGREPPPGTHRPTHGAVVRRRRTTGARGCGCDD